MRVALVALRPLTYQGRAIAVGERFVAKAVDAAVLTYRKDADFAPRTPAQTATPGSR